MLPGPVSKAMTWSGFGVGRNRGEVGNAADVLRDASDVRIAIERVVEKRHQRRAFAAGGHVGGTKIRNDRDAEPRRDHRAFAGLPGDGEFASEKRRRGSLVIERLAVASDEVEFDAMFRAVSWRRHRRKVRRAGNSVAPDRQRAPIPHSSC